MMRKVEFNSAVYAENRRSICLPLFTGKMKCKCQNLQSFTDELINIEKRKLESAGVNLEPKNMLI